MTVLSIITDAGHAALINAKHNGTAPVTISHVGVSATTVIPLASATSLAGEIKRLSSVAGEVVAADTIHITVTDASADAYSLRSVGVYLADGTLFAIYGQTAPILEKASQSIAALAFDLIFADIDATMITFGNANFTNPPATTERQGVIELATNAEAKAGDDAMRAITPATALSAVLDWMLVKDGAGSGLDADMLDGREAAWFADVIARLGYAPDRIWPGKPGYSFTDKAPPGYLKANGAAVSRTAYDALFAEIGTRFGVGDGSTTFNLPDARGEFFRGWDDGRGVDSGRAIGSWQADEFRSHNHHVNDPGHVHSTESFLHNNSPFGPAGYDGGGNYAHITASSGTYPNTTGIWLSNNGGGETRPRNIALLVCIAY